ncbi:MAG: VWA domain-containing protein [Elusimicrobiaceae bacterium]|nr:VWA domain-containing protein [Elusimicrobiaceae bacterium]
MRFLAPHLLYFLPLALLPLAIYYLVLKRALKVNFPGLYLVRKVYLKNLRGRRFLRAAVLGLRCLAVGLLILAFSRPVLERLPGRLPAESARDVPVSAVVLLDLSYSTRAEFAGRPVSAILKDAGSSIISRLGPADKVAVGAFSDRWEGGPLSWEPPARAAARLAGMTPSWRVTDYRPALEKAFAFLGAEKAGKKAVIVLTDGFARGFKGLGPDGAASVRGYSPEVELYGTALPAGLDNRWVSSVSFNGAGLLDGGFKTVPLLSAQFGGIGRIRSGAAAAGQVNGLALRRVAITERQAGTGFASWPAGGAAGGTLTGRVFMEPDALQADNSRWFAFRVPRAPKLLCLSSDPQFLLRGHGGHFLKSVLGENVTGFSCLFYDLARLQDLALSDYQGVIAAGFSEITARQAELLRRFVLAGGHLLLVAGPQTQPSAFRFMEDILPVRPLRAEPAGGARARLVPPASAGDFDWAGYQFGDIKISGFLLSTLSDGAQARWKIKYREAEYPAFAEITAGKGRVFFWTPGLETAWTDFALRPVFPVWAGYAAARLGNTRISVRGLGAVIGEPFKLPVSDDLNGPVDYTPAAGPARQVRPANGFYEFPDTDEPGIYRVAARAYGGADTAFAVNPDSGSGESVTEPAPAPPWTVLKFQDPAGDFFARAGGLELFGPVLAFALALLALEFFLAGLA